MRTLLPLLVAAVYLLHQDVWNWHDRSLVFGFLPKGLAYHAFYACLCSVMMALLVRFAWPGHIEAEVEAEGLPERPAGEGH